MTVNSNADNPLIGTWRLVRWDIMYGDGRPDSLPFGADATGLILYSGNGSMNACIARAARPRLSSESVRSAPEAERLAAFEGYFQYAGPYRIQTRDGRQQVVHTVTHALNPAGNTSLTHLAFATSRFCISQSRRPPLASASTQSIPKDPP